MSQSSLPRLGFIGAGRLARCLALSFSRAGYPVTAVASRSAASAGRLASQIEHCAAFDDPQQVVDAADIVFLAVPDDSIGTTAHTLRFMADAASGPYGKALVHCSGASPVELLAPARDQGASIGGFHPLYLFSGDLADTGADRRLLGDDRGRRRAQGHADGAGRRPALPSAVDSGGRPHAVPRRRALRRQLRAVQPRRMRGAMAHAGFCRRRRAARAAADALRHHRNRPRQGLAQCACGPRVARRYRRRGKAVGVAAKALAAIMPRCTVC